MNAAEKLAEIRELRKTAEGKAARRLLKLAIKEERVKGREFRKERAKENHRKFIYGGWLDRVVGKDPELKKRLDHDLNVELISDIDRGDCGLPLLSDSEKATRKALVAKRRQEAREKAKAAKVKKTPAGEGSV